MNKENIKHSKFKGFPSYANTRSQDPFNFSWSSVRIKHYLGSSFCDNGYKLDVYHFNSIISGYAEDIFSLDALANKAIHTQLFEISYMIYF